MADPRQPPASKSRRFPWRNMRCVPDSPTREVIHCRHVCTTRYFSELLKPNFLSKGLFVYGTRRSVTKPVIGGRSFGLHGYIKWSLFPTTQHRGIRYKGHKLVSHCRATSLLLSKIPMAHAVGMLNCVNPLSVIVHVRSRVRVGWVLGGATTSCVRAILSSWADHVNVIFTSWDSHMEFESPFVTV